MLRYRVTASLPMAGLGGHAPQCQDPWLLPSNGRITGYQITTNIATTGVL